MGKAMSAPAAVAASHANGPQLWPSRRTEKPVGFKPELGAHSDVPCIVPPVSERVRVKFKG
jgi:hypothetical protein